MAARCVSQTTTEKFVLDVLRCPCEILISLHNDLKILQTQASLEERPVSDQPKILLQQLAFNTGLRTTRGWSS